MKIGNSIPAQLIIIFSSLTPFISHAYDAELFRTNWQVRELSKAIDNGNIEGVKQAIDSGVEINYSGSSSPLHQAVFEDQIDIVVLLLSSGAEVDQTDALGRTPLHDAAIYNRAEIAHTLIIYGAQVDAIARSGTPLSMASQNGSEATVRILLEKGAAPNRNVGISGTTALHIAAANGNLEVVQLLLDSGAELDALNLRHQTPLHEALTGGTLSKNLAVIELLLQRGADVNLRDETGRSVVEIVDRHPAYYNNAGIIKIFEKYAYDRL